MSTNMAIMVGTIGQGVMRSTDCGDTWEVLSVSHGLYNSAIVRTLLVNPKTPETNFLSRKTRPNDCANLTNSRTIDLESLILV